MNGGVIDTELIILENLYAQETRDLALKQRDLAQIAKTSLGMINSILKRMVQKGWITAKKLNSRNIRYAVTLEGINEIFQRSYSYFKRTIKNVAYYRDAVAETVRKAAEKKFKAVLLLGTSDLEFIIEHECNYCGISFLKSADKNYACGGIEKNTFVFFAEDIPFSKEYENGNCVFISQLLLDLFKAA